MNNAQSGPAGGVPQPILETLRLLIRRARHLILLRGACAVAATALGAFLVVMAVDAGVTIFSPTARWVLSLSAYGATVLAAFWFLARPLARSFTLAGIARVVEQRHPELQERISSAVELMTSGDAPELRGSDQLIAALVDEASVNVRQIEPRREVTWRAARPFLVVLAAAALLMAGAFIAWPLRAPFLLVRASVPFANLPNVHAQDLVVSPGDTVLLEGRRLEVEARVANRAVRGAGFRRLRADGSESVEEMTLLTASGGREMRFAFTCPPATEGFRYRIHAGDAVSRYYDVRVVPPPAIVEMYVRYEYPQYTRQKPVVGPPGECDIRALAGTTLTVVAKVNRVPKEYQLLINGSLAPGLANLMPSARGGPTCTFRFPLSPGLAGRWRVALTDENGFTGASQEYTIEVVPDRPPKATVVRPEEKMMRLPPTARIPVSYTAEDDMGLARLELLTDVDGRAQAPQAVALPRNGEGEPQAAVGETALDLSRLMLKGARKVTFQLRATDNLPASLEGPQHGVSELYTVELDVRAPTYAEMRLDEQELKVANTLRRVQNDLKVSQQELQNWQNVLSRVRELNQQQWDQLKTAEKKLGDTGADVARTAQQMKEGYFEGLSDEMEQVSVYVHRAQSYVQQIPLTDKPEERAELAQKARESLQEPIDQAAALLQQLQPAAAAVRQALQLDDLARRQAELTESKTGLDQAAVAQEQGAPTVAPEELQKQSEAWKEAQADVAKEAAEVLRPVPGVPQSLAEMDREAAAQLAAEVQKMAAEQAALAQATDREEALHQIEEALAQVARQQEQLAQQAAAQPATQKPSPAMAQAAENIREGNLAEAVQKQAAAEEALAQVAQQLAQAAQAQAAQPQQPAPEQAQAAPPEAAQAPAPEAAAPPAPPTPEQVTAMAEEQKGLREKTADLMAQRDQAMDEFRKEQVARLGAEQEDIARRAEELAERVEQSAPQPEPIEAQAVEAAAQAAEAAAQAAEAAADAAEALKADRLSEAAADAAEAGEQLAQLADSLEDAAKEPFAAGAQPEEFAPEGATPAEGQEPGPQSAAQPPQQGEQGAHPPQPAQQGQPGEAAQQGEQPAAPQPAPEPPPSSAQLAQEAAALAERQGEVAEQIEALARENPAQEAVAQQETIAERAADMADAAQLMRQHAEQMGLPGHVQQQASAASQQLNQAGQQASKAAEQLARLQPPEPQQGQPQGAEQGAQQGQPQGSRQGAPQPAATPQEREAAARAAQQSQQASAQSLQAAAQSLNNLGQMLAQEATRLPQQPPEQMVDAAQAAQAYEAATEAAQDQQAVQAAEAAEQLGDVTDQAMQQAQRKGGSVPRVQMMTYAGMSADSKRGTGPQIPDLSAAELKKLGIELEDWARLPGDLRSQIIQAAYNAGPDEYRPLIKQYFREIARRGGEEEAPKK